MEEQYQVQDTSLNTKGKQILFCWYFTDNVCASQRTQRSCPDCNFVSHLRILRYLVAILRYVAS
jgi:hypothetical protein